MIIQGSGERDTSSSHQFQIPLPIALPIPIPIHQGPSLSISTSLSLGSPQIIAVDNDLDDGISTSSTFSSSSSYFQLLGSLDGSLTPLAAVNSYSATKRALEQQLADAGDSDECADPKKRRLMKNRESATRSRARKLALMNELKVEVARLEEENLKLKDQCKELKSALAAANASTKKLRRTFSADF